MNNIKIFKKAKKFGYLTAAILLATIAGQLFLPIQFPDNGLIFEVFTTVMTLVITYTYFVMLKGVEVAAHDSADEYLIAATKKFIQAVLVTCVGISFYGLLAYLLQNESFTLLLTIMVLGLLFWFGILSIKISKGFANVTDRYGKSARRAALWHKISGWLMVSVVLSPIGILTSLIADYYMWKVVSERLID